MTSLDLKSRLKTGLFPLNPLHSAYTVKMLSAKAYRIQDEIQKNKTTILEQNYLENYTLTKFFGFGVLTDSKTIMFKNSVFF